MRRYIFPVLMGVVGVAILMSLGFWQLRRSEEKRVYLDEIAARISNAPIPLPAEPEEGRDKFQAVYAEGASPASISRCSRGRRGQPRRDGDRGLRPWRRPPDHGPARLRRGGGAGVPRPPHEGRVEGNSYWPDDTNSFTPPPDEKTGLWVCPRCPGDGGKAEDGTDVDCRA